LVERLGAQVIPIDAKPLKGSYNRERQKSALHVWQVSIASVLGQVKVSEKSNEITAIPALLEVLALSGCIITIDAMGTQTAIAAQNTHCQCRLCAGAQSQPSQTLWANKDWFEQAQAQNFAGIEVSRDEHVESSHHRIEKRQVFSVPVSHLAPVKLVGLDLKAS